MPTLGLAQVPTGDILLLFIGEPSQGQRHVGVAYRGAANGPLRYLHLAGHRDLRDDADPGARYRAVRLTSVAAIAHNAVVAQCKRAAQADLDPQHISYGLGFPRATIRVDPSTNTMLVANASGLTCATFVCALFGLASVPLVDITTWQDRQGDADWKAGVISYFSRSADTPRRQALESERDLVRVRPEDVAGAAAAAKAPASFDEATAKGDAILDDLRKHALPDAPSMD